MTTKLLCLLSLMMLAIPAQALPLVAGTSFTGQNFNYDAKTGDFNGDGNLDFLMTETSKIHVYLGDGTGLFTPSMINFAPAVSLVYKVLVRDMDGDNKLDLVILQPQNPGNTTVFVSLGDGLGGFATPTLLFTAANTLTGLHFADLDNNALQDLIMFDTTTNEIVVSFASGPITYGVAQRFPTGGIINPQSIYDLQSGDLNGDGRTDLTVLLPSDNNVAVFLGTGTQTLAAVATYPIGTVSARTSVLANLNADAFPDLAIAHFSSSAIGGVLSVLLNNGAGGFLPATRLQVKAGSDLGVVEAADFNMDGKMDLLTAPFNATAVLLGNGAGGFAAPVEYATVLRSNGGLPYLIGDFNNDTSPDVIALGIDSTAGLFNFTTTVVPLLNTIPAATGITGAITINNNAASTSSTAVTLQLSCLTAASAPCASTTTMQFSNDNTVWSAPPVLVAASTPWSLSSGLGTKTVYARFTDTANNISTVNDTITLIAVPSGGGGCLAPTQSAFQYLLMLFVLLLVSAQIKRSRKSRSINKAAGGSYE